MEFNHVSVLLNECLDALNIKKDGIYVDGTLGGAGHSLSIVKLLDSGKLIGIDQDLNALEKASNVLSDYKDKVALKHSNYENIGKILNEMGLEKVDGIFLDLGVSSHQLDSSPGGFLTIKMHHWI